MNLANNIVYALTEVFLYIKSHMGLFDTHVLFIWCYKWSLVALLMDRGLKLDDPWCPFQQKPFYDSVIF